MKRYAVLMTCLLTTGMLFAEDVNWKNDKVLRRWIETEVYVLISKEEKEILWNAPTRQREHLIESLWRYWSSRAGFGFRETYQERYTVAKKIFRNTREDRAMAILVYGLPDAIVLVNKTPVRTPPLVVPHSTLFCSQSDSVEFWFWGTSHPEQVADVTLAFCGDLNPKLCTGLGMEYRSRNRVINDFSADNNRFIEQGCSFKGQILHYFGCVKRMHCMRKRSTCLEFFPTATPEVSFTEFLKFSPKAHAMNGRPELDVSIEMVNNGALTPYSHMVDVALIIKINNPELLQEDRIGSQRRLQVNVVLDGIEPRIRAMFIRPLEQEEPIPDVFYAVLHDPKKLTLSPGTYTLHVMVQDGSEAAFSNDDSQRAFWISSITLEVERLPYRERVPVQIAEVDPELTIEEYDQSLDHDVVLKRKPFVAKLFSNIEGLYAIGRKKFYALIEGGEASRVEFYFNNKLVSTDNQYPFSATIDLRDYPYQGIVRAVAYRTSDDWMTDATYLVNVGKNRFVLMLDQPRVNDGMLNITGEVAPPFGVSIERINYYQNETLLGSFDTDAIRDGRFKATVPLPSLDPVSLIRVEAVLEDGTTEETLRLLSHQRFGKNIQVQAVEVPVVVIDTSGAAVANISADRFTAYENDRPQKILQVLPHTQAPIHIGLLFDISSSMRGFLIDTQQFGLNLLKRVLMPQDRAFLLSFASETRLHEGLTNNLINIEKAMMKMSAVPHSTAIYDAIAAAQVQFDGLGGRKVIIMLTDGQDTASKLSHEEIKHMLEYSSVTLYIICFQSRIQEKGRKLYQDERSKLQELSHMSGGKTFFLSDKTKLQDVYDEIEQEIRNGYLVIYASDIETLEFRKVDIVVNHPDVAEVRTIDGYYPELH